MYIIPESFKETILTMTDSDAILQAPPKIQYDAGSHSRAKIRYVLLATEQTVQDDVMRLRPPGVGVHLLEDSYVTNLRYPEV